jgi:L-fuconolactonase
MSFVDTHCHASLSWYEPIERLIAQMDANDVEAAVLIQIQGEFDNSYQRECVRRFPDRLASVVLVDHTHANAVAVLEREAGAGAIGIRLRSDDRSPGDDPLLIWRAAERLGLVVSCACSAPVVASPAFADLVAALPNLTIVLEHLAGQRGTAGGRSSESTDEAQLTATLALARFPNVYVKVPGLGEFCRRAIPVTAPFPFVRPIPALLPRFVDAFGASRLMWGSDSPPVSTREGYGLSLSLPMAEIADRTAAEQELIFGGVARSVFAIGS